MFTSEKARHLRPLSAVALVAALGCTGQAGDGANTGTGASGTGGSAKTTGSGGTGGSGTNGSGGSHSGGATGTGAGSGSSEGSGGSSMGSGGSGDQTGCAPLPSPSQRLWRLSAAQWSTAVKDLLGLSVAPTVKIPASPDQLAFFSDTAQSVSPEFQYALYDATQQGVLPTIATKIGGAQGAIAPCSGTTAAAQTACAQTFIQTFTKRAYRRPPDSTEIANLMKVYAQGATQDYATGIELMIQAALISTSFVYRTELGPTTLKADATGKYPDTALTPYEVATQLGFLFLGSVPDDQLIAAADSGSLGTAEGIGTQIDRLLAKPQVQANLDNIVVDWFNVRQMFTKTKNTSLFSALAAADQDQSTLQEDIYASTQKFVNEVFWMNPSGTVDDLMTSQSVWVNKRLATLYPGLAFPSGAPTDNTTFVKATWPASQGRSGMLTQPGFLWAASDPDVTSIVHRGKFIHDDVLCQDFFGAKIDTSTPTAMNVINCKSPDGTKTLSACDSEVLQSDARMTTPQCAGCHAQMDPYARVLLNFGPIGDYRTTDEGGHPIDPTVTFAATSPFGSSMATGAPAFGQALAKSGVLRGCSVQKIASYALGQMIQTYNTCELNDIRSHTDGTIASLFKSVATAGFLRTRAGGTK